MKKAFDLLVEKGVAYEFHNYKTASISEEKIKAWFKLQPWERFINKQGLTWKKLDESVKSSINNETAAIKLMQAYTSLIKRPIVESGKKLIIGFDVEQFAKL